MKNKFTFLLAAAMLLIVQFLPWKMAGQTKTDELAYTISFKDSGTASDVSLAVMIMAWAIGQ